MTPRQDNFWIRTPRGRLRATLHLPAQAEPPFPAVIGVHGLLSNRQSQKQIALARRCTARGMAYLRFDHLGCGESEGDLARDTSLSGRVADLRAVWADLAGRDIIAAERMGLFGSSFGGTVCLAVAARQPVEAIVTLAAPLRSRPLLDLPPEKMPPTLPAAFKDPHHQFDLASRIPAVAHLLCCHGAQDETVPAAHAREIAELARNPKELMLIPNGDHRISDPAQRETLLERAQAWLSQQLISYQNE